MQELKLHIFSLYYHPSIRGSVPEFSVLNSTSVLKGKKGPGISGLTEAHYLKKNTIQTFYMRNQLKEMRIFTPWKENLLGETW